MVMGGVGGEWWPPLPFHGLAKDSILLGSKPYFLFAAHYPRTEVISTMSKPIACIRLPYDWYTSTCSITIRLVYKYM